MHLRSLIITWNAAHFQPNCMDCRHVLTQAMGRVRSAHLPNSSRVTLATVLGPPATTLHILEVNQGSALLTSSCSLRPAWFGKYQQHVVFQPGAENYIELASVSGRRTGTKLCKLTDMPVHSMLACQSVGHACQLAVSCAEDKLITL